MRLSLFFILLLMLLDLASGDVNQDKAECTDQLVGLAPCLPYVGGQAKAPTMDCCGGLKQVLVKSKKCLCVLIKDKDDPSVGLNINASLAATLPHTCHDTVNLTECISLLHLAPNSQEAKLFQGYQKLTEKHSTSPPASGNSTSSAAEKSDGGMGKKRVGVVEIAIGFSLWVFNIHQNSVV